MLTHDGIKYSCVHVGLCVWKFSPPLIQLKFIVQRLQSVHINSACNIASGNKFMNMWWKLETFKLQCKQKIVIFFCLSFCFSDLHTSSIWWNLGTKKYELHINIINYIFQSDILVEERTTAAAFMCMIMWYDPDPDKWGEPVSVMNRRYKTYHT